MWRVKLQEGKDCSKKTDGSWAFPSEFPGYSKTATLMLDMTKHVLIYVRRTVRPNFYLRELTILLNEVDIHSGCVWDMKDVDALQFPYQFTVSFVQVLLYGIDFVSVG